MGLEKEMTEEQQEQQCAQTAQAPSAQTAQAPSAQTAQAPSAQTAQAQPQKAQTKQPQKINKSDTTRLGREKIGKLLLEFAIPAVIGMMFNTLYNIVDTAFLQRSMGDAGAAVATLAFPVMTLLMGFSLLAGQGGNALAAIQMGEGKMNKVEKTLGNTVFLLIALALLVAVFSIFAIDFILDVLSTPAELRAYTQTFVQIICCGFVFQSLGMGVGNFLRTAGHPNLAMVTQCVGTFACIILNYLFVMVWGWGVTGSAWATVLGQACGMVPTMAYFMFVKTAPFRLRLINLIPKPRLVGRILVMGIASFVTQVGSMCVSLVFNLVVTEYAVVDGVSADTALAALGIAMKACSFAFTPMLGIMIAAQPIIGFNFGAKLWNRVLQALKLAIIASMIVGFIFTALAFLTPGPIVGIFGVKDEGYDIAVQALGVMSILFGPVGFQVMGSSYFQSSGQPIKSAILEMMRQILFLIPMYLLLPPVYMQLFGFSGLESIMACLPTSDFASICVSTVFVVHEIRKVRRWRAEAIAAGQPVDCLPDNFGEAVGEVPGAAAGAPAGEVPGAEPCISPA